MADETKPKWYHKTSMLVLAFLCVGPLAIPFVWLNPRYDTAKKILGTALMVAATWLLFVMMRDAYDRVLNQYRDLKAAMGV